MIETNRIEYKSKLTDSLEKEISAFLNYRDGGVVYIGISKDGETLGIENIDEIQLKIKDKLKHNIEPSCLGLFDVIVEKKDNKNIIKIIIASGKETPYYIKKYGMSSRGCFVRIGSSSEPMNSSMIENLFSKRTRNSLNKIRSNRQDLSFEQLKIYYEEKGLKLNEQFASNLELLTEDGDFNYVAYLMSDSNGTSIKVAKYDGIDKVHLIENNEYGYCSLVKATKSVLDKLELENKTATLITSKERINQRVWNPIALKEAVINAIVHNDYTNELTPVFEIYDDRLEITSAGGLSVIKNKEHFFKGYSNPTNREIMRIYKDLDIVEQLGSGMRRILSYYKKEVFEFQDIFLRMVFVSNHDPINEGINEGISEGISEGIKSLLKYIEQNPNQRVSQISKFLNIPAKTLERWVKQLKSESKIEYRGSKKTGGYYVTK